MLKLNSNTLATWCKELTHWKRPWCWEGLGAGGEGDDRGWDGWMASPTRWVWVWVNSGSWWWTGRPGVLRFMGLQRVRHNWATELNWTELRSEGAGSMELAFLWEERETPENSFSLCSHWEEDIEHWWEGHCPPVNRKGLLRNGTWWHLDFELLAFRTVGKYISVV